MSIDVVGLPRQSRERGLPAGRGMVHERRRTPPDTRLVPVCRDAPLQLHQALLPLELE